MAAVHIGPSMTTGQTPREYLIIKTGTDVKAAIDYSYVFNEQVNEKVHLNIIEMNEKDSDEYQAFLAYEELFSKYVVLKPLKEIPDSDGCVSEVAEKLIDIFSSLGSPKILQSSYEKGFSEELERELRKLLPALDIVHTESPIENLYSRDFKMLVESWQIENPLRQWHEGLYYVQIRENTAKSSSNPTEISRGSPAEIFFQRNLANDLSRFISQKNGIEDEMWYRKDQGDQASDIQKKVRDDREKIFECTICLKRFKYMLSLNRHMPTHTDQNSYPCKICGRKYPSAYKLRRHMSSTHKEKSDYKCEICAEIFQIYSDFAKHKKTHPELDGVKKFECEHCSKQFKCLISLKKHAIAHTEEKPHLCDICGKIYLSATKLKRHITSAHHSEKIYRCEYCDKTFYQRSELTYHKVIHNNERPFQCHLCEKCFKRKQHLKNHLVIHKSLNLKAFECEICKRNFGRKHNLRDHIVYVHTFERPYTCNICNKKFKRIDHLNRHKTHH